MTIRGITRVFRLPRFGRHELEQELDDELAYHLARREEALRAGGLDPESAHAEARRRFGDVEGVRAACMEEGQAELRRERLASIVDATVGDLRFAVRSFRRAPGFAIVALAILTLGIAGVTTVFSVINTGVYRPLPYRDAARTVALSEERVHGFFGYSVASLAMIRQLRAAVPAFDRVAAYRDDRATLEAEDATDELPVTDVDSSMFPILGVAPERGRVLSADEIGTNAPVVVVSDAFWRTKLGADARVLGRRITLDGRQRTIVGVMPPGIGFPERAGAWVPLVERADSAAALTSLEYGVIAHLRKGASKDEARGELKTVAARLAASDPAHFRGLRIDVRDDMVNRNPPAVLLFGGLVLGAALLVLLVACTNIANLYLVRAADRRGEMAVRAAMGASRARLVRQIVTESLLLGIVAGALGAVLSSWGVQLVLAFLPTNNFPTWLRFGLDVRVLGFATLMSLVATTAFALLPAREGTRLDLVTSLKTGGDGGGGRTAHAQGRRGIAAQIGLAMALCIGAALVWQSYRTITHLDRGLDVERVLNVNPTYHDEARYPDALARTRWAQSLAERIAARPGVEGVGLRGVKANWLDSIVAQRRASASKDPRLGQRDDNLPFLPGAYDRSPAAALWPPFRQWVVSPAYFRTMGIPILRGRSFDSRDAVGAPYVTVVSSSLARALFHSDDAVGKTLRLGRRGAMVTIVAVCGDERQLWEGSSGGTRISTVGPIPTLYVSDLQAAAYYPTLVVRSAGDPAQLEGDVRAVARTLDPHETVGMRTLRDETGVEGLLQKLIGGVLGFFALGALVLAMIGTYGVIAYGVVLRRREIGVRMALGGSARDVLALIVGQGMRYSAAGLALGLALAAGLARALQFLLVGVSPFAPAVYGGVLFVFAAVSLAACWLPARRAMRIDPAIALRAE